MSEVASGGKVWSLPTDSKTTNAAKPAPKKSIDIFKLFLFCLPIGIVPALIIWLFNLTPFKAVETGHNSILGGYIVRYDYSFSPLFLLPTSLLLVGAYLGGRYSNSPVPPEEPWIPLFLGLPLVIIVLVMTPWGLNNQSRDEWVKATYGYESVSSLDTNIATVKKADGTVSEVGVLNFNNNFYLYENLDQLEELTANLQALEETQ